MPLQNLLIKQVIITESSLILKLCRKNKISCELVIPFYCLEGFRVQSALCSMHLCQHVQTNDDFLVFNSTVQTVAGVNPYRYMPSSTKKLLRLFQTSPALVGEKRYIFLLHDHGTIFYKFLFIKIFGKYLHKGGVGFGNSEYNYEEG